MRINVAFAISPSSPKIAKWHDGFTAAMTEIESRGHSVGWCNLHPDALTPDDPSILDCDFLLVKSNWQAAPIKRLGPVLKRREVAAGLLISGTAKPHFRYWRGPFDVCWYETHWYAPQVRKHPLAFHAFGVDTSVMRSETIVERDIDWFSVGRLIAYKRHELLLDRTGTRVVATDLSNADEAIRRQLEGDGVVIVDYLGASDLASLYRRAKHVLVSCTLQGGGERAVLEAMACGAQVVVPEDNPKLQELRDGPIYDHLYYAKQIMRGINAAVPI
jgi:glycosyltransferase involved in cell wall biosynthesis